jgi:hypothetical protein
MTAMTATLVALGEAASDGERSPPLLVQAVTSSAFATKAEGVGREAAEGACPDSVHGTWVGK